MLFGEQATQPGAPELKLKKYYTASAGFNGGDIVLGPFLKGMPVNLIINMDQKSPPKKLYRAVWALTQHFQKYSNGNNSLLGNTRGDGFPFPRILFWRTRGQLLKANKRIGGLENRLSS